MRWLVGLIVTTALVAVSASAAVADPAGLGSAFTGRLAFGPCEPDQSNAMGCGGPQIIEPFSDARLAGDVAITGWWGGYEPSSIAWFGSWLIGDSDDGWVEVASPRLQNTDATATQYMSVLVGAGVNQGLVAYSEVTVTGDVFDFVGRIEREDLYPITDYSGAIVPGDLAELDW